ncbi:MAG: oligosaccharide flippase family protein [Mediterranea sp.]|jgi:O-antigen/teichoic acid export membrane protein|nr:oligosaccharide flippase family protein [Mediterranea sp.]
MVLHRFINSNNVRTKAVKRNIVASLFIKGISIVVSLMLVPMTLGYVNSEMYGIWLTLSSIMLWLNFFDIGFTLGLKNRLAEAIALEDWKLGKSLVSTTYFMMVVIFIPLLLLLELAIPYIDWTQFLNVPAKYAPDIRNALYVLVVCFCLQMIVNVLSSVIAAFQRVALSSVFPVIGNVLSLIVIFILTKTAAPSLQVLALAISVMPIIVFVIASLILYGNRFNKVKPSIYCIKFSQIKDLFGLGLKFFLIQIQVVVLFQATNILISNLSGAEEVTSYNIAYKYLSVAMMVYAIILSPLWPAFTDAFTKKDYEWMRNIYRKMSFVYLVSMVVLLVMAFLSPIAYHVWIGEKASIPWTMTACVAIYVLISTWDSLQVNMINGIGAIRLQTYVTLIGLVLHIPLSFAIGRYAGAYGVLFSMIAIKSMYSMVFTTQIRRIIRQSAKGIWIQ